MKLLHGSALSSGQTPGQLSEQNEDQRMSKVVRIIFEYKEHVIHKNADGTVRMGGKSGHTFNRDKAER